MRRNLKTMISVGGWTYRHASVLDRLPFVFVLIPT